ASDVSRVANTYLGPNRLVLSYVPRAAVQTARGPRQADQTTSVKSEKKDQARIDAQAAKLPKPGPNPKFALPAIEKTKLANGLEVWMVRQDELPIVSMNLVLKTGQASEPVGKTGVAGMVSTLLDDGTTKRSAAEIANQLQAIGANVNAGSGWDSTNVSLATLRKNLDAALDIYSDIVLNPSFPATELESIKARQIVGLRQQRANSGAIANVVFNKVLYGDHPYGRDNNEASIKAISRDDLVNFYGSNFRPNNGTLIVVGSFDSKALKSKIESAFGGWKAGDVPAAQLPAIKPLDKPGIYIIDRPGAAQSTVAIGQVGVDRTNPDFHAIQVMNAILGGGITSRISMNLREDKGYTYGANSGFTYRRGPGPFRAGGEIQTAVTKEAIVEFMKELNGIRGSIPATQRELDHNKQSIIRRFPAGFETIGNISGQLSNLVVYGLPDNYFNDYIAKIDGVTLGDVNRVAQKYLDPDRMAIVIVGDRSVIEPKLKEIPTWGSTLRILDADGNLVD
ncbi:MAG: pitrilysin family protein, partial [bacterium]|nr:pitrilysin family protein [bacterium]